MARLRNGAAPLALLVATIAAPAFAQTAATTPTDSPLPTGQALSATDTAPAESQDIVVTGSIFRRAASETALPVTVLTAQNLQRAGITTVSDAVRSISADGAGSIGNGFTSGFSAGGSSVSLRNLGVSSTLILIDGLRSTNFPLNDDGHNAYVDLNSIPLVNVQQVQVLKDGASSLYGADAIGGVVNIITRKHVRGIEGGVEAGTSEMPAISNSMQRFSASSTSTFRVATIAIRRGSVVSRRRSRRSSSRSRKSRFGARIRKASAPRPLRNRIRAARIRASSATRLTPASARFGLVFPPARAASARAVAVATRRPGGAARNACYAGPACCIIATVAGKEMPNMNGSFTE